jgi:hypothetical protein
MRHFIAPALGIVLLCPLARAASPHATTKPATTQSAATKPAAAAVKPEDAWKQITKEQIESIKYDDIEDDAGFVTPLAADLDNLDDDSKKRLEDWAGKLSDWSGAKEENTGQRVRNLLSVCCLADMIHSEFEGETALTIFDKLKSETDKEDLEKACAWIILKPNEGKCITKIPELGWDDEIEEEPIRERTWMYAKKLLGRLVGKLPPQQ